jgi:hypothetical protein
MSQSGGRASHAHFCRGGGLVGGPKLFGDLKRTTRVHLPPSSHFPLRHFLPQQRRLRRPVVCGASKRTAVPSLSTSGVHRGRQRLLLPPSSEKQPCALYPPLPLHRSHHSVLNHIHTVSRLSHAVRHQHRGTGITQSFLSFLLSRSFRPLIPSSNSLKSGSSQTGGRMRQRAAAPSNQARGPDVAQR